jgi:hypothetical protein
MDYRNISTMRRKRQKRLRVVVAAEVSLVCKYDLETASYSRTIPM